MLELIQQGAEINCSTLSGSTPLHTAADNGNADAIKILLAYGADVNAIYQFNGRTALHLAAYVGNLSCVKKLIKAGAGMLMEDINGSTALNIAQQCKNTDCVDYLQNALNYWYYL